MSSLLITATEVFEAMGQNPDLMEESLPAVESAILRATIKLEAMLKTSLRPETRKDSFYVSGVDGGPLNQRYTFFLHNGVVQADAGITVSITNPDDGTSVLNNFHILQDKHGKVIISNTPEDLLGKNVDITYTSGFASAESTPDEVKQALLCYVPLMLLSSSAAQADPKQHHVATAKATSMDSIGSDMVHSYMRRQGNAIKPMYSVVVG